MAEWPDYQEVRLDIDASLYPEIVASMTDMGEIGEFEALVCYHALEHLYPHEVPTALKEFQRVLAPGGFAVVAVPDLEDVRASEEVLFVSPSGPIAGLDLIYGLRSALQESPFMAHHTGFTAGTLKQAFEDAGFADVTTKRLHTYNLMGVGIKI